MGGQARGGAAPWEIHYELLLVTRSACAPSLSHNRDQRQTTGAGPAGNDTSGRWAASRDKRVNKQPVDDEQRDLAGQVGGGAWAQAHHIQTYCTRLGGTSVNFLCLFIRDYRELHIHLYDDSVYIADAV